MRLRSSSFTGQWPTGIHWSPGETRELPVGYPVPPEDPPRGLDAVDAVAERHPAPTAPPVTLPATTRAGSR